MNRPPRSISQQVGIIVALFATAVMVGIAIGWLLSPDVFDRMAQSGSRPTVQEAVSQTEVPSATFDAPITPTTSQTTVVALAQPTPIIEPAIAVPTEPPPSPPRAPTERPTAIAAPTSDSLPATAAAPTQAPTISPTSNQPPAIALLREIAALEAGLRSGELDAVLNHGQGTRSAARVRFDFGTLQEPARLDFTTTYQGSSVSQTTQVITVGDRSWERRDNQGWISGPDHKGTWDQVRYFLPQAAAGTDPRLDQRGNQAELRWYDPASDADITLVIDSETNLPLTLQRQTRRTGMILSVTYTRWNMPVEILPPTTSF